MSTKETIVGVKDLRTNLDKYIKGAQRGASFLVVRRSRPVFRIEPADSDEGTWETIFDAKRDNGGKGLRTGEVLRILRKIKKDG